MAILDRMSRLIRANINDLLDRSEDPEKMLNELLREMDSSIVEARSQVANTIAQEKELEADLQQSQQDAREWGGARSSPSAPRRMISLGKRYGVSGTPRASQPSMLSN